MNPSARNVLAALLVKVAAQNPKRRSPVIDSDPVLQKLSRLHKAKNKKTC